MITVPVVRAINVEVFMVCIEIFRGRKDKRKNKIWNEIDLSPRSRCSNWAEALLVLVALKDKQDSILVELELIFELRGSLLFRPRRFTQRLHSCLTSSVTKEHHPDNILSQRPVTNNNKGSHRLFLRQ